MKLLSNILLKAGLIVEGTTNLQGTATTVTQASADNSTKLATTAFVKNQAYAVDSAVVHTTGDESISGVKTFLGSLYVGNSSTNGVFRIYASGGEYGQIAKATGGGLNFTINAGANRLVTFGTGTDGLYIDNGTGNVTLNYSATGGRSFIARVNNSSVSNGPQIEMFQTTTYATINAGKYGGTGVAVPIALAIDGTQRLVVFTDGNTTVGSTTNAGFKFDVNGTARVQGDTTITGNLNVGSSSSFRATIQSAANDVLSSSLYLNNTNAGVSAASYLQFGASGASSWLGLYSSVHSNPSWAGRLLIGMGSSGNGITISASGGASQDILFAVQTGTVMRMMPNRNILVDKVTDSGLAKFQVNGAIQQTSVLSSMLKVDASGVLVAAVAGTDYQAAGSYVPTARQLTINGTAYDLSADRSWTIDAGGATASTRTIQKFTSTASQTTFTITGGYTVGMVDVFLNGTKLDNATDFTATNGTTVVLTDALASGQCVEVYKYGSQFIVNNGLRQTTLFSATAGQTTFTVNYSAGMVDVFYNGSKLDSSEYTATDGTSIVLGTACAVNDKLEVVAYSYTVGAFTGQAQLNGTGFVKVNGTTVTYDNTSYLPITGGTVSNSTSAGNPNVLTIKNNTNTDNGYAYSTLALDTTLANTMADIRLGSTTPLGIRIYAATSPLTAAPTGAGFQLFSNSHPSFSGQVYFDSGAHNSAALIFRTAATGGTITERFRISATGASTFSGSVTIEGNGSTIRSGNELRFNRTDNAIYTRMYDAGSLAANGFTLDNMNGEGFHFKNSGTTIMRMNSAGNVGIGTSTPAVHGNAGYTTLTIVGGTSNRGWLELGTSTASANNNIFGQISGFNGTNSRAGELRFFDDGAVNKAGVEFAVLNTGAITSAMRINSVGNVLIGTLSDNGIAQLQVSSNATFAGGAPISFTNIGTGVYNRTVVYNNTSEGFQIDLARVTDSPSATPIPFKITVRGGTEFMRVSSSGYLLVGTTLNSYNSRIVTESSSSYTIESRRTGTGSEGHVVFVNGNGAVGSIFTSGSGTSYNTSSDYRLKEDLNEIDGLEKVSAIRVYDFKWKSSNERMDGVLAHELAEVLPYAVTGEKDAATMQSVDYSKIVPVLVKAVQEEDDKITKLEVKVAQQQIEIESLKSQLGSN